MRLSISSILFALALFYLPFHFFSCLPCSLFLSTTSPLTLSSTHSCLSKNQPSKSLAPLKPFQFLCNNQALDSIKNPNQSTSEKSKTKNLKDGDSGYFSPDYQWSKKRELDEFIEKEEGIKSVGLQTKELFC
jgi:hypothetical protein